MGIPFQWNLKKREQLGRLLQGPVEEASPDYGLSAYLRDLPKVCAQIVALSHNADLVFIGRSLEKAFDYLSGLLSSTGWEDRCSLLNVSLLNSFDWTRKNHPTAPDEFRRHLRALKLEPAQILSREHDVAFIDVIAEGRTMRNLNEFFSRLAIADRVDNKAMHKKFRFLLGTEQKKTSPKTYRWYQDNKSHPWIDQFPRSRLQSFTLPRPMWQTIMFGEQRSRNEWNPPWRWDDDSLRRPIRDARALESLRLSYQLYLAGCSQEGKAQFRANLNTETARKEPWLRTLIGQLR